MVKIEDFRAGATHVGFALYAEESVQRDGDMLRNVHVFRDGRVYVARPGGDWNVMVVSFEYPPSAENEAARVLASDSTANGLGKAIIAFREGAVIRFPAYKKRGPSVFWYWDGQQFQKCLGLAQARVLGWVPPKEMEQIL